MTETTDARRQARAANDRAIQRFHERAHDRERATRRLAILDFRVNRMPASVPDRHVNDVDVPDFCLENRRTEFDAVGGQFGEARIGRHAVRIDME
ncbi:hypothetical protein, partial [Staphylococcus aureus]|uniref:hypothetical protein n=1 Tax=Staphylococcus aureus TaxID=1280 RepID=UPI003D22A329